VQPGSYDALTCSIKVREQQARMLTAFVEPATRITESAATREEISAGQTAEPRELQQAANVAFLPSLHCCLRRESLQYLLRLTNNTSLLENLRRAVDIRDSWRRNVQRYSLHRVGSRYTEGRFGSRATTEAVDRLYG
jgi:hypothetical protein